MPQIPRLCPGCARRKLQMSAAPCEMCGRVNVVEAPNRAREIHPLARLMRALLAPLGWFTHVLTLIFCVFALWAMTLHWVFDVSAERWILSGLLAFSIWAIRLATRGAVYVLAPATRQTQRPGGCGFWVLPISATVLAVLNHSHAPLRLAFWVSRPALERAALNSTVATPSFHRAGLYRIVSVEKPWKGIRFIVTKRRNFGGVAGGFVYCPQGCTISDPNSDYAPAAPFYIPLAKDWFWWQQDLSWRASTCYSS